MTDSINKVLAMQEDLGIGVGTVVQTRMGLPVTVTQIELNWIFRTTDEIRALDYTAYTRVSLWSPGPMSEYWFDVSSTATDDGITVIAPATGPAMGRWLLTSGGSSGAGALQTDGSTYMNGPFKAAIDTLDDASVWYEDQALTIPRIKIWIDPSVTNRAGLRVYDVDGNDGDNDALIDIRTETDPTEATLKSGVIQQPSQTGTTAGLEYTGIFGFNDIQTSEGYAQFAFQGTGDFDRRAWFGTSWTGSAGPEYSGLNNLQLYINRPGLGTAPLIDLLVADSPIFNVSNDSVVDLGAGGDYRINGVSILGAVGGVDEAPIDGNEYTRKDAGWTISTAGGGGDFLPRNGSLPMIGPFNAAMPTIADRSRWYEDVALTTPRIEMWIEPNATDDRNRSGIRLFDVDGNAGDLDALIDIRTQSNNLAPDYQSAVIQQRGDTGSQAKSFTGNFGFNNILAASDYAQFAFQGIGDNDRRAWFGTNWVNGSNPAHGGLNNIQLFINRPALGDADFIKLNTDGVLNFRVDPTGAVFAGGIRAAGDLPVASGTGVELFTVFGGGVVRGYNSDASEYVPLVIQGDYISFATSRNNPASVVEDVKIWQNPNVPTEDEFAIFNQSQFRIYRDGAGATRSIESIGTDSAANGLRIINYNTDTAGITMACQSNGHNFISVSSQPTSASELTRKDYVDGLLGNTVTTNTTQTISGVKTFSGSYTRFNQGLRLYNNSVTSEYYNIYASDFLGAQVLLLTPGNNNSYISLQSKSSGGVTYSASLNTAGQFTLDRGTTASDPSSSLTTKGYVDANVLAMQQQLDAKQLVIDNMMAAMVTAGLI